MGNLESLCENADADGDLWRELVAAWWAKHQDGPVCVSDLLALCRAGELMGQVLGDGSERSQATRLGAALRGARDRVFGDYQVRVVHDPHVKRNQYRLGPAGGRR
ncbi:MAG: hypothetical protein HY903_05355 [Deltaproteobacteria bacterium]|nr:hypothetical protein [Deltaproteobacteria bacterium]